MWGQSWKCHLLAHHRVHRGRARDVVGKPHLRDLECTLDPSGEFFYKIVGF